MATYTADELDSLFDTTHAAALSVEKNSGAVGLFSVESMEKADRDKYEDILCHASDKYETLTTAAVSGGKIETLTDEIAALNPDVDIDQLVKDADGDTKKAKVLAAYLSVFNTVNDSDASSLLGTLDVLANEYAEIAPTRAEYSSVYGYLAMVCLAEAIEDAKEELDAIVPDDVIEHEEDSDDDTDNETDPLRGIDTTVILSGRRTRNQVKRPEMVEFDDSENEDSGCGTEEDDDFDLTEELADAEEDYSQSEGDDSECEEEDDEAEADTGSSDPPSSKRRSV